MPVKHAAWRLNNLSIAPSLEFSRFGTAVGVSRQLPNVQEDTLHQLPGSGGIVERDIVRDRIQIGQGRFCPDYFSHRAMRCLALAWVSVRPSSTAFSPRAMPSSKRMRCCCAS